MPSPHPHYYSHHHQVVVAAVLCLCAAALAAPPGTATGVVGPPPPSPHNSSVDGSGCLRRCGDVHIPYPFGAGPAESCSVSPVFRLHCNDTAGNGVPKLFLRDWLDGTYIDIIEVVDIDVIQGQMRVVSQIFYSCFINDNTTSEGSSLRYVLPNPYRFSSARNKFMVLGCLTWTYMLGKAFEDDAPRLSMAGCAAHCSLKEATKGSCAATIQGNEGLRYYQATCSNRVNETRFNTTYPCAYAVLMDSSYAFNISTSYLLAPSNEFNKSRVPVVVYWDWVIPHQTCRDAPTQPAGAGYACVSDHSKCVDATRSRRGYLCQCVEGFQGNPYVKQGCKDIDECKDNSRYPCYGNCNNRIGTYECVCPEGTQGNASIGECIRVQQAIGIIIGLSCGLGILILGISAIVLVRRWKINAQKKLRRKYFRKNQGLLLEQLISSDENASENTRIFSLEELEKATNNFDPARILGHGGHGTVYKGILSDQHVVAIKKSNVIKDGEINDFINEVAILSQINHRNIVKLFGCCLESEVPLLVYDFIPNGSLFETLHAYSSSGSLLTWNDYLRIATEAAGALYYLHSAASISIFHRDVKSSNILLDGNYTAKVSDFGASRSVPIDQTHVSTNVQGTFGYLDPEYYQTGKLNEKSDVYSFGMVLLELLLRKQTVFTNESGMKQNLCNYFLSEMKTKSITEIVAAEVLVEATVEQIEKVASLAEMCLRLKGDERPTMKQVEMTLQLLLAERMNSSHVDTRNEQDIRPLLTRRAVASHRQSSIEPKDRDSKMLGSIASDLEVDALTNVVAKPKIKENSKEGEEENEEAEDMESDPDIMDDTNEL